MKKNCTIVYLLFFSLIFFSCSKKLYPEANDAAVLIPVKKEIQRYNLQIDFMKNHFSGMLIVREMGNEEIRLIYSSYFGMSIFDFGLLHELWIIHSSLDPLLEKRVQILLESDFKLLFLGNRHFRNIKNTDDYTKYTYGRGLRKTIIYHYRQTDEEKEKILIEHPWLRLKLILEEITN